jgi:large subunit ribosomal protein L16
MLMPKRTKHRKQFRGSMAGKATRGNKISNGEFGIVAMEPAWIKSNQIEAARVAMTRYVKRTGKVWIKISLISLTHLSLSVFVWVKVKVTLKAG